MNATFRPPERYGKVRLPPSLGWLNDLGGQVGVEASLPNLP
jgi:hypothetical protein